MITDLSELIARWREDEGATYQTWFLWDQRLKNFRSIRRGIAAVVQEIEAGTFGNAYKGSSLQTVVGSIAEQRQIFKGADHAFLWKPKLRIPDIYEDDSNQKAFGRFLNVCVCCSSEAQILGAIQQLDAQGIKGLGPAAANMLYFLHPTTVPPFNTAIVKGYNALTGANVKLGRWSEYLAMREGILRLNEQYRSRLSNDLGAIAGLLFDIGTRRYSPPPVDADSRATWLEDLNRVRASNAVDAKQIDGDRSHTEIQAWLRDLGKALGFSVWVAANDRNRVWRDGRLGDGCLPELPQWLVDTDGIDAIKLIDVLWIEQEQQNVAAAFEVEHTTSIYSGIVRMLDLALGTNRQTTARLFLVGPDSREEDVRAQLCRPAFSTVKDLRVRFIPYSVLEENREAIMRFGTGLGPVEKVAKSLN